MPGTVSEVSATFVASTTRRPPPCRWNTRCCSPEDSRAYNGRISSPTVEGDERVAGVADLALTREEHQNVAGAFGAQLVDRVEDRLGLVAVRVCAGVVRVDDRPVPDLHRVGAAGDLDDGRVVEMLREPLRVDRGRSNDHLEVRPARQQPFQVAENEVDVEAALVRLVDDQRVVLAELAV